MFKYLKRQYADALLTFGILRIGTLSDFRRLEHARGVTDPDEGKKTIVHDVKDEYFSTPEDAIAFNEFSPIKIKADNIRLVNLVLKNERISTDCFVFCLSSECSETVRQEFDGVDACIQITNNQAFITALTAALNSLRRVRFLGVYECRYQKREEKWNGVDLGSHPALIKDPKFKRQKEIRMIWDPLCSHTVIEPLVIGSGFLPQFCRDVSNELSKNSRRHRASLSVS